MSGLDLPRPKARRLVAWFPNEEPAQSAAEKKAFRKDLKTLGQMDLFDGRARLRNMSKMTLEEVRDAAKDLSEDEQELLYLDLAMKMEEVDPQILRSHLSLLEKRWTDFASGNAKAVPLDEALQAIDDIQDA